MDGHIAFIPQESHKLRVNIVVKLALRTGGSSGGEWMAII